MPPAPDLARAAVAQAARHSYGRLLAFLAARTRDLAGAEDALAEAFAQALATWPAHGVPHVPEAWLMAVARRKTIDAARRRQTRAGAAEALRLLAETTDTGPGAIPDERLRLMFTCAHPAIDPAIRAPLILQTVLGFDAARIADAFLVAPAAMGQRLVRAKRKIAVAGIPFRVPEQAELADRLEGVLDAVYAVFGAGWSDPALAEEAIWLGQLVAELLPAEPEALGLLALMLHVEARRAAGRDPHGDYVPLGDQDPAAWDGTLIADAEAALREAHRLARIGRFQLEAAIQSVHAERRRSGRTDWGAVVMLYDALLHLTGSPVVAVNRAVAVGELRGALAGLLALNAADADTRLTSYQPYWAARAALCAGANDRVSADMAYAHAIALSTDPAEQAYLRKRATRPT